AVGGQRAGAGFRPAVRDPRRDHDRHPQGGLVPGGRAGAGEGGMSAGAPAIGAIRIAHMEHADVEDDRAITLEALSGAALRPRLDEVARLRIAVFRDWPYLYAGDVGYEREYLDAYAQSPDSVVVLARDGDAVVGASTGIPLAADGAEFQAPFLERGIEVAKVFYCGE